MASAWPTDSDLECPVSIWSSAVQFLFADHMLDTDRRELHRGPDPIPVEPQVFDLLLYLVQNRDRVVSKDDLIASVWGGRIVSESTAKSEFPAGPGFLRCGAAGK